MRQPAQPGRAEAVRPGHAGNRRRHPPLSVENSPHVIPPVCLRSRLACVLLDRPPMMNRRAGLVLFFSVSVSAMGAGCGDDNAGPGPAPADLRVDGNYEIVSTYDLSVGSVLPQPVATYAQEIVGLRNDPAGTLFRLLDQAGVPLASDLMDALPDPAANELKKWINDFVAN